MEIRRRFRWAALTALLIAPSAIHAAEVTFEFTGRVTDVTVDAAYPAHLLVDEYRFAPGDTYIGVYTFETNSLDTTTAGDGYGRYVQVDDARCRLPAQDPNGRPDNICGVVRHALIAVSNGWTAAGREIREGPFGADSIRIENDRAAGAASQDSYFMATSAIDGPSIVSESLGANARFGHPSRMTLYLVDSSANALSSEALSSDAPPLGQFDDAAFRIDFHGLVVHGTIDTFGNEGSVDTDGDGLPDVWEIFGYPPSYDGQPQAGYVDLRAMGANVRRKDIFVEVDCTPGMCPSQTALEAVKRAFADAGSAMDPSNAIDRKGIALHVDAGPDSVLRRQGSEIVRWGVLSEGGDPLPGVVGLPVQADPQTLAGLVSNQLAGLAAANTSVHRKKVFRYAAFVQRYHDFRQNRLCENVPIDSSSGVTLAGAPVFLVAMQSKQNDPVAPQPRLDPFFEASTFMHELGHTLGLGHGGPNEFIPGTNTLVPDYGYKPHYFSIMNYRYQDRGLMKWLAGVPWPVRSLDYARLAHEQTVALDEATLSSSDTLGDAAAALYATATYSCPAELIEEPETREFSLADASIAWDCGSLGIVNINGDTTPTDSAPFCAHQQSVLTSRSDWRALDFTRRELPTKQGGVGSVSLIPESDATLDLGDPEFMVTSYVAPEIELLTAATARVTVRNIGKRSDGYRLSVRSETGLANATLDRASVSIAPHSTEDVGLTLTRNFGAKDRIDTITVRVGSVEAGGVETIAEMRVRALAGNTPTAVAGADANVVANTHVVLSAAASSDPDGDIRTYLWQQTSGPPVVLAQAATSAASFDAPAVAHTTSFEFTVSVTDATGLSSSDSVVITVSPPAPPPSPSPSLPPAASPSQGGGGGSTDWLFLLAVIGVLHCVRRRRQGCHSRR